MNSKSILFLGLFAAVALTTSGVNGAMHGGATMGGGRPMMGGGHPMMRGGAGNFHNGNFDHFHHFHHNNNNNFVFIGDFGFPWWWGWGWGTGWGWGYPYGYGYGYPYYGYGYGGYGYGYGPDGGYGYGGYGYGSHARVAELQRRLARAGYYHGSIDGILGPATRRAIRSYERNHGYVG